MEIYELVNNIKAWISDYLHRSEVDNLRAWEVNPYVELMEGLYKSRAPIWEEDRRGWEWEWEWEGSEEFSIKSYYGSLAKERAKRGFQPYEVAANFQIKEFEIPQLPLMSLSMHSGPTLGRNKLLPRSTPKGWRFTMDAHFARMKKRRWTVCLLLTPCRRHYGTSFKRVCDVIKSRIHKGAKNHNEHFGLTFHIEHHENH